MKYKNSNESICLIYIVYATGVLRGLQAHFHFSNIVTMCWKEQWSTQVPGFPDRTWSI